MHASILNLRKQPKTTVTKHLSNLKFHFSEDAQDKEGEDLKKLTRNRNHATANHDCKNRNHSEDDKLVVLKLNRRRENSMAGLKNLFSFTKNRNKTKVGIDAEQDKHMNTFSEVLDPDDKIILIAVRTHDKTVDLTRQMMLDGSKLT